MNGSLLILAHLRKQLLLITFQLLVPVVSGNILLALVVPLIHRPFSKVRDRMSRLSFSNILETLCNHAPSYMQLFKCNDIFVLTRYHNGYGYLPLYSTLASIYATFEALQYLLRETFIESVKGLLHSES